MTHDDADPPGTAGSKQRLADRPLEKPDRRRLSERHPHYDDILEAHAAAMARGESFYCDPATGLSVLTAGYLAGRGECCEAGCRHCPYLS
jgi:hypothetical protein